MLQASRREGQGWRTRRLAWLVRMQESSTGASGLTQPPPHEMSCARGRGPGWTRLPPPSSHWLGLSERSSVPISAHSQGPDAGRIHTALSTRHASAQLWLLTSQPSPGLTVIPRERASSVTADSRGSRSNERGEEPELLAPPPAWPPAPAGPSGEASPSGAITENEAPSRLPQAPPLPGALLPLASGWRSPGHRGQARWPTHPCPKGTDNFERMNKTVCSQQPA